MRNRIFTALILFFISLSSVADIVAPSERVTNSVIIRQGPSSNTANIGNLRPGESLPWIQDQGRWRQVQVNSNQTGWVSKSWTIRVTIPQPSDPALAARAQDQLRIHYLSVGAGTCTVVECPGANAPPMIIDCGSFGASTRGPNALDEAATAAAIDAILNNHTAQPNLVLSHADKDHYSYLDSVLDQVQTDHIWQGGASSDYPSTFRTLLTTQHSNGATLHQNLLADFHNNQFELGNDLSCGDASVFILTVNSGASKNANSLVLSIDYGDFSAVFTGDAEGSTERAAITNYDGAVKATVLSGSHHGADTHGSNGSTKGAGGNPSGWAEATAPEVMIYSHGRKFGHPRCSITDNFHGTLATVPPHPMHCGENNNDNIPEPHQSHLAEYSTEVSGTIAVTTNGRSPLTMHCDASVGCAATIPY